MGYIGIPVAALAAWLFGAAWYMSLGKHYQAALGQDPESCKGQKMPVRPLAICFLAELVMAAGFSYVLARMSVVGWYWGAMAGFIIGLFVIAPTVVVNNIFPGRKPALSLIDGGHWVGVATIIGVVTGLFA